MVAVTFRVELPADVDKREALKALDVVLYREGGSRLCCTFARLAGMSVEESLLELKRGLIVSIKPLIERILGRGLSGQRTCKGGPKGSQ